MTGGTAQRTALFSVLAAALLVAVKLVAGLVTGSLGLVAEAAHSGTDLVAALLTLFAIRVATRPADEQHHYGHGKAEHLAALAESTFLIVVSGLLAWKAVERLASDAPPEVDAAWWAFAVLGLVIVVDASRATLSYRAAREHHSAALESNALHFASDLLGTLAVLVGLAFVAAGEPRADSIAALVVAAIVLVAAGRLVKRSIDVLMDRASEDAERGVRRALEGLRVEVRRLRVRQAAGRHFVDLVVALSADAGLAQAHTTADAIEEAVRSELPGADVLVHVEPRAVEGDLRERATVAALSVPDVREIHNVRVMQIDGGYELSLHVKLPRALSLADAHETVEQLETAVRAAVPALRMVHTHIEPLARTDWASKPSLDEVAEERDAIDDVVRRYTGHEPAGVRFRDAERGRVALITVLLPPDQPLPSAHRRAGEIEQAVRERCPSLADVIVHTEPAAAGSATAG
ncbi:MAG TPA: cation diffusion facilitator family transporter [Solirubrobacteraceae bacterium]|jgi:cation diffusion facilitator family transporter|nr:cation diffusion facilitator family transporter [Solirubrobacteraceae bacterium]